LQKHIHKETFVQNLRASSTVAFGVGLVLAVLAVTAWAADSHVGTWKLNIAKSKSSPGSVPKSATLKIEAIDNGYKYSLDGVDGQGKPTHAAFSLKADGKDYPVTGLPYADTMTLKRIDANTTEAVAKKGGKVTVTTRSVVSQDAKTRTSTQTEKNEQGQDVKNILVYDKQ
jgi:hypothetical protein